MKQIASPFQFFADRSGDPLDAGYIYIGAVNQNPETTPIAVYWDEAGTQPAAQPLRTSAGYIVNGSTRGRIYVGTDDYSMTIKGKAGNLVDSVPSVLSIGELPPIVPIERGGTGATTVAAARTALGAAESGTNNDITSLGGLESTPTVVNTSISTAVANVLNFQGTRTTAVTSGTTVDFNSSSRNRSNWWNSSTNVLTAASAWVLIHARVRITNSSAGALSTEMRITANGSVIVSKTVSVSASSTSDVDLIYIGQISAGVLRMFGTTTWAASGLNIVGGDAQMGVLVFA